MIVIFSTLVDATIKVESFESITSVLMQEKWKFYHVSPNQDFISGGYDILGCKIIFQSKFIFVFSASVVLQSL